jgi:GT2 family glycosyltransferase
MTQQCLKSFFTTADPELVSIFIVDNGSTDGTVDWLRQLNHPMVEDIVYNDENLGTARALNIPWKIAYQRGQHAGKLDNDVIFYDKDWSQRMYYIIETAENVGLVGLKRRDLEEKPNHNHDFYRTTLHTLPNGIVIEEAKHVMGTCWLVANRLLNKLGGLYQFGPYGLDDAIWAHRTHIAGYLTVFDPSVAIEHIDPGDPMYPEYTQWKRDVAGQVMQSGKYDEIMKAYADGTRSVFEPFE